MSGIGMHPDEPYSPPMPAMAYYADDVDYGWPVMCEECDEHEATCGCVCCEADPSSHFCESCCPCRNKDKQANQLACDAIDCGTDPNPDQVAA